jgi:hypothetical protein
VSSFVPLVVSPDPAVSKYENSVNERKKTLWIDAASLVTAANRASSNRAALTAAATLVFELISSVAIDGRIVNVGVSDKRIISSRQSLADVHISVTYLKI